MQSQHASCLLAPPLLSVTMEMVVLSGKAGGSSGWTVEDVPNSPDQPHTSSEDEQHEEDGFLPDHSLTRGERGAGRARGGQVTLQRDITLLSAVGVVTGQIIGAGIYVAPQNVLRYAGSFGLCITLWIAVALVAVGASLCYVELGLLVKKSGGEFVYLVEAYSFRHRNRGVTVLGALMGFLCVWVHFFVNSSAGMAAASLLCAQYFIQPFFTGCCASEMAVKCFAIVILIIICAINILSVKVATRIISAFAFAKVLSLLFIVLVGVVFTLHRGEFPSVFHHPFVPTEGYVASPSSLSLAVYGVFWSYDGWNVMNYTIEETRNLGRNLPLSVMIGVPIVAVCYALVNISYFAVLSYDEILTAEAIALPFGLATLGSASLVIIPLMVGVSIFGSATSTLLSTSRITFVAARDGFLPRVLSGLHVTQKTPLPAILIHTCITGVLIWIGNISDLIEGQVAALFLVYVLCLVGMIIMRFTHREEPRLFKAWFILPVAVLTVVVFLFLVFLPLFLQPIPSLVVFSITLLGAPVYLILVMETPWRLRPKFLDAISSFISDKTCLLLNTAPAKIGH